MGNWVTAFVSASICTGIAALVRAYLIAHIILWSLKADEAGRKHALALLQLLRFQLRRAAPPTVGDPSKQGSSSRSPRAKMDA